MNATPSRTLIRLTLAGAIAAEIDPNDASAVNDAMGRMFRAKQSGDATATMERVTIPGSIAPTDDDSTIRGCYGGKVGGALVVYSPNERFNLDPEDPRVASIREGDDVTIRPIPGRYAEIVTIHPPTIADDDSTDDDDGEEVTVQIPAARNPLAGALIVSNGDTLPGYPAPSRNVDTRINPDSVKVDMSGIGSVVSTVRGGEVSNIALQRVTLQDQWAKDAGFVQKSTVWAMGTRCIGTGDSNFRAIRQSVASMPTFANAARMVADAVQNEDRQDLICKAADLRMDDDGRLTVRRTVASYGMREADDVAGLSMDFDAFRAFCHRTGNGSGATYLGNIPRARRAHNVNADLSMSAADYMLRTRRSEDGRGREIFAVLSPGYAVFDADSVMALAAPHLADTNAEVVWDGSRLKATALWMPDQIVDLAAGDVFKAGVRITTSDVGGGSVRVDAVLWRNRCLNLIIVGTANVETCRRVHKGHTRDIAADVDAGIRQARDLIGPFLESWGAARRTAIGTSEAEIVARIEAIVTESRGGVKATKAERETAIPAIVSAWRTEPGFTVADLANALTRAAHESADFADDYRAHLERRAGLLVTVGR